MRKGREGEDGGQGVGGGTEGGEKVEEREGKSRPLSHF